MPTIKFNRRNETILVTEYMWNEHKTSPQWRRVRLGPLPTHERARMYQVTLRWADAIYIEAGIVHIVEAKLRADAGAIGQLQLYKELFRATPEFKDYWNSPIQLVFLCTKLDLPLAELCKKNDIIYELYNPFGEDI